jgi:heme exporter protein B
MSTYLRKVSAIVWKDVTAELRTKDIFSGMFVFALLAVVIFQFAFDLRADNVRLVAPGVIWVAIAFAGVLGLNRSFILEQDRGSLEGLLLAPVDRSAIYFGKLIGNLIFILAVELVLLPVASVFFNIWLLSPAILLFVALGTIGFAAVGTLFSALSVNTRAREVLLPILLFPIMVPVFIAGVRATSGLLDGEAFSELGHWLRLLLAYDAIFIAAAFLLFDYVVEE